MGSPPHRKPPGARALECLRPPFGRSGILHLSSMPPEGCSLPTAQPQALQYLHTRAGPEGATHPYTAEGLVAGASLRTPWCGPRMRSRSAGWQPCAMAKACPSSPSAQAPGWRVESARSRYALRLASSAAGLSRHTCPRGGGLLHHAQRPLPAILLGGWPRAEVLLEEDLGQPSFECLPPGWRLYQPDPYGPNPGAESRRLLCGGRTRRHPQSSQHPPAGPRPLVPCG